MSAAPDSCVHLTVEIVKEIHGAALAAFGGTSGIRDEGLLHSAVAAPQATLGGQSPFADLAEVAGAYLFYLCRNHPFVDGNKRAALAAALAFLWLNGQELEAEEGELTDVVMGVAEGRVGKAEAAEFIRTRLRALQP